MTHITVLLLIARSCCGGGAQHTEHEHGRMKELC